jgi:hypothetical protein
MAEIINLNRERKRRARDKDKEQSAANRARCGRAKWQRAEGRFDAEHERAELDGKRLEDSRNGWPGDDDKEPA